jgi:hypothetical protein
MADTAATRKTANNMRKPVARRGTAGNRRKKAQRPLEPSWVKEPRKRKQALSLAIDEQEHIAFWKCSCDGPHNYNLMAWHPEGDLAFGCLVRHARRITRADHITDGMLTTLEQDDVKWVRQESIT